MNANLDELKKDIAFRIDWSRTSRLNDKKMTAFIAVYIGLVSAITTVCIGIVSFIPKNYAPFFGIVSLLASASLTVIAAWDGIFNHKKLWLNSATTLNEFYELETDIRHAESTASELDQEQINEFYARYKTIMRNTNERWHKIRG